MSTGILNMGRRFRGPVKSVKDLEFSKGSVNNDKEDKTDKNNVHPNNGEDKDYTDELYPPADEKYRLLENRLNAMEHQRVPGLNVEDMGLVPRVIIPPSSRFLCLQSMKVFHVLNFI